MQPLAKIASGFQMFGLQTSIFPIFFCIFSDRLRLPVQLLRRHLHELEPVPVQAHVRRSPDVAGRPRARQGHVQLVPQSPVFARG